MRTTSQGAAPRPRPGIMEIKPYVGGKAGGVGQANLAKLSANENALGASPRAVEAYQNAASKLHRYPDGGAVQLRAAIGGKYGIDPGSIVCGAGSDELISLLMRAYAGPGDEVLYSAHGFLMYRLSALAAGAQPVPVPEKNLKADVEAMLGRVTSRTRMVFIANPNNPTGSYIDTGELKKLRDGLPVDVLLVIDAAYAEFVGLDDYDDGLALASVSTNTVMTRTFSKIHGLAALRLGWMTAAPEIIDVINRIRGPFNVSAPALEAGLSAIQDDDHIARSVAHNDTWRPWLEDEASELGLKVHPSVGNFVLVEFDGKHGLDAVNAARHMEVKGVIPRDVVAYGLPDCLRITVGTEAENRLVIDAMRSFLQSAS